MIYILQYVTFDWATQTLRYEPRNFGQISIFCQIWTYFQRNHLSIKNYYHINHSQSKLTKKMLKNSNIKKFWKLCPNFDGLCMNDESKYLGNSFAEIFYNIRELLSYHKIGKFCIFKSQHCSRMSRILFPFLYVESP